MQTECTDNACTGDSPIVPSQSALDQIVSTLEASVAENGDIWMPMSPSQQPIWPRVWPGL